jgi:hypothetical protein
MIGSVIHIAIKIGEKVRSIDAMSPLTAENVQFIADITKEILKEVIRP